MSKIKDKTIVARLQSGENISGLAGGIKDFHKYTNALIYDDEQINALESSNKESLNQPTSIPSPFARIALVKTAFAEVAEYGEKALKAYQKIVSDTLDVAEIFFTFDKWQNKVEIIKWDKNDDLKKLEDHKILHKTLKTFLDNDAEVYNFDKMKAIYILKHKATGEMIGATSPCTLFFSSANDLSKVDIPLSNNHSAFKSIFPLHQRGWDFQKYLYTWLKLNNDTRQVNSKPVSIFNELQKYLESQKPMTGKIEEIENQLPKDFSDYGELRAPDVEVLGKPLHKAKLSDLKDNKESVIKDYLDVDSLLEKKIIRLPYKIQKDSFFDGNLNETSKFSYLLPVTDIFFKHYSVENLQKWIKINEEGTGSVITVRLDIPNSPQKIERKYKADGTIIEIGSGFDCMLFPNITFTQQEDAFYRFGLFLPYTQKAQADKYSVDFYKDKDRVEIESPIVRNVDDNENPICKTYSLNQKSFDRIKITNENANGFLLPNLHEKGNSEYFTFAVDFGTTNTHIEYKNTSDNTIRPFDIQENNKQISFLLVNPDSENSNALVADIDFIPLLMGNDEQFKFPIRTALSLAKNKEDTKKAFPFVQANVVIPYEKRQVPKYNRVLTQLKWDSTEDEMGYFIDSLCFMLRNKVVLNSGNLSETKIVWFYPLSMAGSRSEVIREKWKLSYSKYFLGTSVTSINDLGEIEDVLKKNIIELPESVAPFLCYKDDPKYKDAINNLVSIDIGGGTTDIVFIKDGKKAEYVTSFRFAANSVFGLGEHITPIVTKYQSEIEQIIEKNDPQWKLRNILSSITSSVSGDLASFFFSLSNNDMLKDVEVNFNSMLKRDKYDQKLVFVLFYAAIVYHTAQIMKAIKLPLPRHITFSGNGSRIVNIIADKEILEELSKAIFEYVFKDEKYSNSGQPSDLNIIQNTKNPKEVTCKGGIKAADKDYIQTPFEPVVLLGTDDTTFINSDTYSSVNIEDSVIKTRNQIKIFVNYVVDDLLNQKYTKGVVAETFVKALDINQRTLQIAKDVIAKEEDLSNFTRNGINRKIESISDTASTQIEETFFFYPIASLLNVISNEINKKD
jgi:hypothetical protein